MIARPCRPAAMPGTGSGTMRCEPSAGSAGVTPRASHNPTATRPGSRTSISEYVLVHPAPSDATTIANQIWRPCARRCDANKGNLPGAAHGQLVAEDVDGHRARSEPGSVRRVGRHG